MHQKLIIILSILLCLTSCGKTEASVSSPSSHDTEVYTEEIAVTKHSRTVFAMDTVAELTAYSTDDTVLELAEERFVELEHKLSVTLPESEIYALNRDGTSTLSEDSAYLLEKAAELCEDTGGALDITVYPIVSAWGFTTGNYRIPTDNELEALLQNVGCDKISHDGCDFSVSAGVRVDLGSVAKGYAGDVITKLLSDNGVTSALLNLGGNVQALGSKPDGSDWKIAVRHPLDTENYLGILQISDMAAITSGGYERYFVGEDGNTYCHIIDPATGKPAESGLLSVTVVGESGLLCDAMSTALFVMGLDDAAEYWRSHDGFDVIFVTDDGKVYVTEGIASRFTLSAPYDLSGMTVIERGT